MTKKAQKEFVKIKWPKKPQKEKDMSLKMNWPKKPKQ
jgi:hypothetical protein